LNRLSQKTIDQACMRNDHGYIIIAPASIIIDPAMPADSKNNYLGENLLNYEKNNLVIPDGVCFDPPILFRF